MPFPSRAGHVVDPLLTEGPCQLVLESATTSKALPDEAIDVHIAQAVENA